MSLRLRRGFQALVGAALAMTSVALMLVLFPSVAEAQGETQSTSSIVVRPGDCLWSITSERLGPNANPRQIALGVERTYALNRSRIGTDPHLIFPGQELALPQMGAPSKAKAPSGVPPANEGADAESPAAASPTARGGKLETEQVSSTKVSEASSEVRRAPQPVARPVVLPDMPTEQVTPHVGSPFAPKTLSPLEFFARTSSSLLSSAASAVLGFFPPDDRLLGRKLLGLGIIGLTLLITALMAWKLPMRRNVVDPWGWCVPTGHYSRNYAILNGGSGDRKLMPGSLEHKQDSAAAEGEASTPKHNSFGPHAIERARRRRTRWLRTGPQRTRRMRAPNAGRFPRKATDR